MRVRAWLGLALMTVVAASVAGFMVGHSSGVYETAPAGAVDTSDLLDLVDRDLAARAAANGEPFVYQLRGEHRQRMPCHPRLRMPDGRDYALDDALTGDAGAVLDGRLRQFGCGSGMQIPPR